jgi:hypothetical protein
MCRREAAVAVMVLVCLTRAVWAVEPTPPPVAGGEEIAWTLRTLATGDGPFEVLATDLDGDGDIDLAVGNFKESTIGIYFGNGDGTFAPMSSFPTGNSPRGLVAVDLNRDGIVDLVAAATHGDGVFIHMGEGKGRFAAPQSVYSGGRPFHAITADFNADGLPDIAVANETRYVSILLGDGHGGLTNHTFDSGKWPSNVAAADFNEDGHLDFAATNWGDNAVSIQFGTGDGVTFSAPKLFSYDGAADGTDKERALRSPGHGLFAVIAPDLDRDGHADMVWNDLTRSAMYVLYGDGHGRFPRTAVVAANGGVRSVRAVDLNGDGWLDLVSADTGGGDVSVALADGKGGFQQTQHVPAGVKPRVVATGDFNGDGRPDLAVTNIASNSLTVMLNQGLAPRLSAAFNPGPQQGKRVLALVGLQGPANLVLAPDGELIVADRGHHRVVRLARADGAQTTIAGTGQEADSGDGDLATEASLRTPLGLAVDGAHNLYIADFDSNRVRKVDPAGIITTVAGTGEAGFAGDGGPAVDAQLSRPYSIAVDSSGALFIADLGNLRIRRVDPSGTISTVVGNGTNGLAGDGGPATAASLGLFSTLAVGPDGTLYIADQLNRAVRTVNRAGVITTIAGGKAAGQAGDIGMPTAIAVGADGRVYLAAEQRFVRLTPNGGVETVANLASPDHAPGNPSVSTGFAVDSHGVVYATVSGSRVISIDPAGAVKEIATASPEAPAAAGTGSGDTP